MPTIDLAKTSLRDLNATLHQLKPDTNETLWNITNPAGEHSIAVGVDAPITINIDGNVGYYCGGMNNQASIIIEGSAGQGVGENMMSGLIHVKGDASQSAGATGRGGRLIIEGNASARCGISMKGIDIVVKGDIGHLSAFMGQNGRLVVFGEAGEALGDSYTKRTSMFAALSPAWGLIASRRRCATSIAWNSSSFSSSQARPTRSMSASFAATARPANSTTSTSTMRMPTDDLP